MASNSEWLARKLLELEQQVQALGRGTRLGHSSLQGESILALDEDGEVLAELGTEGGAGGVVHLDGPEPPRPTAPVLEQGVGTIFVRWDGAWHPLDEGDEGEPPTTPIDFDRIEVHATTDPEATEWDEDTLAGSITQRNGGVVMIRGWDIDDVVIVRLVCRSLADKLSEPSEPAEVTVTGIDIAAIAEELDAANLELSNLDGTMFAVGAELDALEITFKNLDTSIINTDDGTLADALTDAREALEAVQLATEGKNRITRSLEGPPAEYDGVENDLWWQLDSLGQGGAVVGQWRWGGTEWVSELIDSEAIAYLDAAKITAGTLEADRIATGSIGARAIAADAVEAGKIAADSISGREIIANTVKAEHIAAFTITADELAANSVSTDKLVANSVIADKLAANSVIAEKIAALAVTADKIAANAVTADKIAANAITAGKIEAGAVTGEVMSADALNFKRAVGLELSAPSITLGGAVEITEDFGIRQFGPDGALNVSLPSDGSPAEFRGDLSARTLTATGRMSIQGSGAIASGGVLELESGVVPPVNPPGVSAYLERTTFPPLEDNESPWGLAWAEGHWWRAVAVTGASSSNDTRARVEKLTPTGDLVSSFPTVFGAGFNGLTLHEGLLYTLGAVVGGAAGNRWVVAYNLDGTESHRWEYENYGTGTYQPGIGTNGTDVVIAQTWAEARTLTWRRFNPANGALRGETHTSYRLSADVVGINLTSADYGTQRVIVTTGRSTGAVEMYTTAGALVEAGGWYANDRQQVRGTVWANGRFHHLTVEGNLVAQSTTIYPNGAAGPDTNDWWAATTWSDGTSETTIGPARRFTFMRRTDLRVSFGTPPEGVTQARVYLARKSTEPSRADFHLVGEVPTGAGQATIILPTGWAQAEIPPAANSFPNSTPGIIRSTLGQFEVDGTGAGRWGPLEFHQDGSMSDSSRRIASGQISVDATANVTMITTVTFPAGRFTREPILLITPRTDALSRTPVVGSRNVTAESAQIAFRRSNDAVTFVNWLAIEQEG